jgi:hypothetical protein
MKQLLASLHRFGDCATACLVGVLAALTVTLWLPLLSDEEDEL